MTMIYLCPRCKGIMQCVSTASIPAITTYHCNTCGYVSKPEKENIDCVTLPPWLWNDEHRKNILAMEDQMKEEEM